MSGAFQFGGTGLTTAEVQALIDASIADLVVGILPANSISNTELAQMPALSVKGNATNATADPQDIAAAANDRLLARVLDALSFTQLTNGMIPANTIGLDKLANASLQYNLIGRKTAGAGAWEECTRTELSIPGLELANTFTRTLTLYGTAADPAPFLMIGDGTGSSVTIERHTADAQGVIYVSRKSRGPSYASPSVPLLNDNIGQFNYNVYNGSAYTNSAQLQAVLIETGTVSSSAVGSRLRFRTCAIGSSSITDTLMVDNTTGFQAFGSNVWFDTNRIFRPRSYTVSTLPTATTTGIIHCSDLGGGGALLQSNGSAWCRVKATGTANIAVDASLTFTWTRLTNAPVSRANVALTATRTVTLSTTGCQNGDRALFVRSANATGAFNWDIAGNVTVSLTAAKQWVEFEFDGSQWNPISGGTIP